MNLDITSIWESAASRAEKLPKDISEVMWWVCFSVEWTVTLWELEKSVEKIFCVNTTNKDDTRERLEKIGKQLWVKLNFIHGKEGIVKGNNTEIEVLPEWYEQKQILREEDEKADEINLDGRVVEVNILKN